MEWVEAIHWMYSLPAHQTAIAIFKTESKKIYGRALWLKLPGILKIIKQR